MQITVQHLVNHFQLMPHPEGGYYKETYRSSGFIHENALPDPFVGKRHFSTAIYFLLERGNFSAFHRIRSDELWHFYTGDPLIIHVLNPDGSYTKIQLGNRDNDPCFQAMVPAGAWFASETAPGGQFSFVGCTVSPGFDFADFELAESASLMADFPDHAELIGRLCR
ncbi:MAG: cupin domain-containing protein [Bacteroidota bacterium]|nr:cupin domain-containing protein [Bacteroidota bacterium]